MWFNSFTTMTLWHLKWPARQGNELKYKYISVKGFACWYKMEVGKYEMATCVLNWGWLLPKKQTDSESNNFFYLQKDVWFNCQKCLKSENVNEKAKCLFFSTDNECFLRDALLHMLHNKQTSEAENLKTFVGFKEQAEMEVSGSCCHPKSVRETNMGL